MGVAGQSVNTALMLALLALLVSMRPGVASVLLVTFFTIILSLTSDGVRMIPILLTVRKLLLRRLQFSVAVPYVRKILGEKMCCNVPQTPVQFTAKVKSKSEVAIEWAGKYNAIQDYLHTEAYLVETMGKESKWMAVAVVSERRLLMHGLEPGQSFSIRVSARNSLGQSKPSNIVTGKTFQKPNENDGGSCEKYVWGQGKNDVTMRVSLKSNIKSKDVSVEVHPTSVSVSVSGEKIVAGKLHDKVKPDDCIWDIETNNQNEKLLNVHMPKLNICEHWPCVVQGDPKIDTSDIVYGSKWLGNYKGDLGVRSF